MPRPIKRNLGPYPPRRGSLTMSPHVPSLRAWVHPFLAPSPFSTTELLVKLSGPGDPAIEGWRVLRVHRQLILLIFNDSESECLYHIIILLFTNLKIIIINKTRENGKRENYIFSFPSYLSNVSRKLMEVTFTWWESCYQNSEDVNSNFFRYTKKEYT